MMINIGGHEIGEEFPTFIIAELSANHNHDLSRALAIVEAAAESGADALKIQTYTPDTLTLPSNDDEFRVDRTIWEGKNLYQLYSEAHLPWEWHEKIFDHARTLGLIPFSTPFDFSAVDFLERLDVPAFKIASSELVDLPLIRRVSETGKPIIISTGMGTICEIAEAVDAARDAGCRELILLKCTAAYPAPIDEANLLTIPHMQSLFDVIVGLSDHTAGSVAPVVSVAMGARVIEKHLTLSRADGGPDAAFSMEPLEFKKMVDGVRAAEISLGKVTYKPTEKENRSRDFRRSLYVVADMQKGEPFNSSNVKSVRPAKGLHTRYLEKVMRSSAKTNIKAGSALAWSMIDD